MELPYSWASSLSAWGCSCHPLCAAFPSAAPPEPACLPSLASPHRDLFLKRTWWGSTALQCRYPREMSVTLFSRCLHERAPPSGVSVQPQVQLSWWQYPLKLAEILQSWTCGSKQTPAAWTSAHPSSAQLYTPFLTLSKKYSPIFQDFGYFINNSKCCSLGTDYGVCCLPMTSVIHLTHRHI